MANGVVKTIDKKGPIENNIMYLVCEYRMKSLGNAEWGVERVPLKNLKEEMGNMCIQSVHIVYGKSNTLEKADVWSQVSDRQSWISHKWTTKIQEVG